jgi:hypothetical protein
MARFRVICPIDQKEKNNGSTKGSGSFMGAQRGGRMFGRVHDWQHESQRFGHGLNRWNCAGISSMG